MRRAQAALRDGDAGEAIDLARVVVTAHPRLEGAHVLLARALLAAGQPAEAAQALSDAEETLGARRQFVALRARALGETGDFDGMRATLTRLQNAHLGDPVGSARAHALAASLERQFGNHGSAALRYQAAYREDPEPRYLAEAARSFDRAGSPLRALDAYQQLQRLDPMNAAYARQVERLRRTLPVGPNPR
jgi:tetratricopeptide (TPR) repeat protein